MPREALPDREKKERREQFHGKIAKSDLAPTICAAATEQKPADQWQILMPWDRYLASGAKRAARFVDRKINRQTVNADVQKRTDRGTQDKSERAEEKLVDGR